MRLLIAVFALLLVVAAPAFLVLRARAGDGSRGPRRSTYPEVWHPGADGPAAMERGTFNDHRAHARSRRADGQAIPGSRPDRERHGKP